MRTKKSKVKLIPLGGLGEIGKNITAIEYENEIIVIDCGLSFPDNEMYGIDLVIPDISYLLENREKVKGIFITHGHEDHIGALPYILKEINVPVYATKFTLSLIESKLIEFNMVSSCSLNEITLKEPIKTEHFTCEFIRTCHSIADSCSLAINNESNKNQTRANGNIGLKIPSKIKQRLLGFPFQSIFSSLPTINSNSDFA